MRYADQQANDYGSQKKNALAVNNFFRGMLELIVKQSKNGEQRKESKSAPMVFVSKTRVKISWLGGIPKTEYFIQVVGG